MAKKIEAWESDDGRMWATEDEALRADAERRWRHLCDGRDADELSASELFRAFLNLARSDGSDIESMISQIRAEEDI